MLPVIGTAVPMSHWCDGDTNLETRRWWDGRSRSRRTASGPIRRATTDGTGAAKITGIYAGQGAYTVHAVFDGGADSSRTVPAASPAETESASATILQHQAASRSTRRPRRF